MNFDSDFKPLKFKKKIIVFYKEDYGYIPVVRVFVEAKSSDLKLPIFTISQSYVDLYNQWHSYFDKFIIFSEKFKEKDYKFYYQVFNWKNKLVEDGRVKI